MRIDGGGPLVASSVRDRVGVAAHLLPPSNNIDTEQGLQPAAEARIGLAGSGHGSRGVSQGDKAAVPAAGCGSGGIPATYFVRGSFISTGGRKRGGAQEEAMERTVADGDEEMITGFVFYSKIFTGLAERGVGLLAF